MSPRGVSHFPSSWLFLLGVKKKINCIFKVTTAYNKGGREGHRPFTLCLRGTAISEMWLDLDLSSSGSSLPFNNWQPVVNTDNSAQTRSKGSGNNLPPGAFTCSSQPHWAPSAQAAAAWGRVVSTQSCWAGRCFSTETATKGQCQSWESRLGHKAASELKLAKKQVGFISNDHHLEQLYLLPDRLSSHSWMRFHWALSVKIYLNFFEIRSQLCYESNRVMTGQHNKHCFDFPAMLHVVPTQ